MKLANLEWYMVYTIKISFVIRKLTSGYKAWKCVPELLHPGEDCISDLQGLGHGVSDRLLKQSSGFKEGLLKDHFDLLPVEKRK